MTDGSAVQLPDGPEIRRRLAGAVSGPLLSEIASYHGFLCDACTVARAVMAAWIAATGLWCDDRIPAVLAILIMGADLPSLDQAEFERRERATRIAIEHYLELSV